MLHEEFKKYAAVLHVHWFYLFELFFSQTFFVINIQLQLHLLFAGTPFGTGNNFL